METDDNPLTREDLGRTAAAFWLTVSCVAILQAQSLATPRPDNHDDIAPIASTLVKDYHVEKVDMEEALLRLYEVDRRHVVIGFERIPHKQGERGSPITLKIESSTVTRVVQLLCQADPRYEYQVVRGLMIEVRPRDALADNTDLLNVRIRDYKIHSAITASGAVTQISSDAVELRELLYQRALAWSQKTGVYPGSAGSIMSGNIPPPEFALELHNVTVRQILDAISIKSIEMFSQGPDYDKAGRQIMQYPAGWQYDFIIKPDATTGLGGIPEWRAF